MQHSGAFHAEHCAGHTSPRASGTNMVHTPRTLTRLSSLIPRIIHTMAMVPTFITNRSDA